MKNSYLSIKINVMNVKAGVMAIALDPEIWRRFATVEVEEHQEVREKSTLDEALEAYELMVSKVRYEWDSLSDEDKAFFKAIAYSYLNNENNFIKFYSNLQRSTGVKFELKDYILIVKSILKAMWSLTTPEGRAKAKKVYEIFNEMVEEILERVEEENEDLRTKLQKASSELKEIDNLKVWNDVDEMLKDLNRRFWEKYA